MRKGPDVEKQFFSFLGGSKWPTHLAVRSEARLQESSRGITLPSLMHSRRGILPQPAFSPTHTHPSYACTINFPSKYSQARGAVFQGKSQT